MAATVTLSSEPINFGGGLLFVHGTITMDSVYPTGGEAVTPGQFKGGAIRRLMLSASTTGIVPAFNASTSKVMAFWVDTSTDGAALAEVTASTDLATTVFPFTAYLRP
jgi:hypothetical protein